MNACPLIGMTFGCYLRLPSCLYVEAPAQTGVIRPQEALRTACKLLQMVARWLPQEHLGLDSILPN